MSVLRVAHRIPRTAEQCGALADAGATMFEADVQIGADGRVFVSHHLPVRWLRGRVTQDNGRFRLGAGPPYDPTLAEVLDRLPAGCGVLLDPKEKRPDRRARLLDGLRAEVAGRPDVARFAVSTDELADLEACRAMGLRTWRTLKAPADLTRVVAGGPLPEDGVSVRHTLLDAGAVRDLHGVVATVVAWTVNDVARAARLLAFGVDGLTTDRPEVLSAARRDEQRRS